MIRRAAVAALIVTTFATGAFAAQAHSFSFGWNAVASALSRRRAVEHPAPKAIQANADSYSVARGQTLTVSAANGVLANDTTTSGKALSATLVTSTAHGTVTLSADGGFRYVNDGSSAASDSFTYTAGDGSIVSSPATVTIAVSAAAPVAAADTYSTTKGTPLVVQAPGVLANDTVNGALIVSYGATGVEQTALQSATPTSQGGSVVLGADGSFTYTGASAFSGTDSFKYVLRNDGGSSTATVTINVQAPSGPDFLVTSPGFFYSFNGAGQNPPLTLTRGRTYTFQINTSAVHPFEITGAPPGSVTNNNISNGTITFRVPDTAANYAYDCSIHGFGNTITTVP